MRAITPRETSQPMRWQAPAQSPCAYTAIARGVGWEVFSCEDMGDLAGAIREHNVDVLIFDFSPENAFDALRKVRCIDATLPTILITAHPLNHEEAMSLGVKMILPKPPDPTELRESLAAVTTTLPGSDFKVLFEFLARCEAARPSEVISSPSRWGCPLREGASPRFRPS